MALPFEDCTVLLILHLLSDIQGFLRTMQALGLAPERTVISNIPYSTKEPTLATLWTAGFRHFVIAPEYPIDDTVAIAVDRAVDIARTSGTKLLVIEDGGYAGPFIHRSRPEALPLVAGIVEQTQNGIWQYDADEDAGKAGVDPAVPVVSVATSELKKTLESPLIGDAIYLHVAELVGRTGIGLSHLRTLILGYGATGSRVAQRFKQNQPHNPPQVFDQQEERRKEAEDSGFDVPASLADGCAQAQLIIGCTGRDNVLSGSLLLSLGDAYFANGSSKRKEINWRALEGLQVTTEMLPRSAGRRVILSSGHQLTLLADGFPVNFVGESESVPDEEIAFVYGLLLQGALLVLRGELGAGFHEVPDEVQTTIRNDHFQVLDREPPES